VLLSKTAFWEVEGRHAKDQVGPETLERNGTAILMFRERRFYFTKSSDYKRLLRGPFLLALRLSIMVGKVVGFSCAYFVNLSNKTVIK
jgi:hypothetical protein